VVTLSLRIDAHGSKYILVERELEVLGEVLLANLELVEFSEEGVRVISEFSALFLEGVGGGEEGEQLVQLHLGDFGDGDGR
jgi:hypothetical protein